MSDSVSPHRQQATRLPHPWDSPGKNTGVGCHFLLQCMKVKSESKVTKSCPIPSDSMDCTLPVSSIHGIFQEKVLEWGAISFSMLLSLECTNHSTQTTTFILKIWINCLFSSYEEARYSSSLSNLSMESQKAKAKEK